MTNSFWQVVLVKNSKKYIAFQHRNKTFHFRVSMFHALSTIAPLVRSLDCLMREVLETYTMVYVDDIVCMAINFKQH